MLTVTYRHRFAAAHRLVGHSHLCRHLHGHNYLVEVVAAAAENDDVGRVVDFQTLKQTLGTWVDVYWDHAVIANDRDRQLVAAINKLEGRLFLMGRNPTAENMADHLLNCVCPGLTLPPGVEIISVKVWETENCNATATR